MNINCGPSHFSRQQKHSRYPSSRCDARYNRETGRLLKTRFGEIRCAVCANDVSQTEISIMVLMLFQTCMRHRAVCSISVATIAAKDMKCVSFGTIQLGGIHLLGMNQRFRFLLFFYLLFRIFSFSVHAFVFFIL